VSSSSLLRPCQTLVESVSNGGAVVIWLLTVIRVKYFVDIFRLWTPATTTQMASKSKPANQQKFRKFGLTNGPLRATQSFGLTPKSKVVEPPPGRLQASSSCAPENVKSVASPHQSDGKDSRRSSSPDSPGALRRGGKSYLSVGTMTSSQTCSVIVAAWGRADKLMF